MVRGQARGPGGRKSPSGNQRQKPVRGSEDEVPEAEAEAECENSIQFLTFSRRKFKI